MLIVAASIACSSGCMLIRDARSSARAEERYQARFGMSHQPELIETARFAFKIPPRWGRAARNDRWIYGDGHHVVEVVVVQSHLNETEWITQRFPGAKAPSTVTLGGRPMQLVVQVLTHHVVAATVVAAYGNIFELSCSFDDTRSGVPDNVCNQVLKSFWVK